MARNLNAKRLSLNLIDSKLQSDYVKRHHEVSINEGETSKVEKLIDNMASQHYEDQKLYKSINSELKQARRRNLIERDIAKQKISSNAQVHCGVLGRGILCYIKPMCFYEKIHHDK